MTRLGNGQNDYHRWTGWYFGDLQVMNDYPILLETIFSNLFLRAKVYFSR